MTEADLANMLGLTRQTLQNYKTLASLIPEVEDFIDTGIWINDFFHIQAF